jgi:hypothetical protein
MKYSRNDRVARFVRPKRPYARKWAFPKASARRSHSRKTDRRQFGVSSGVGWSGKNAVPNFVPHLNRKTSQTVVKGRVQGSPLLTREISMITRHHTQSSSPFSELIIRCFQIQILAGYCPFHFWHHFGIKTPVRWVGLRASDRLSATVSMAVRICPSFSNPIAHPNTLSHFYFQSN